MYRNILVATDGSKLSAKAIKTAIEMARAAGAKIIGFYATPEYNVPIYSEGAAFVSSTVGRARWAEQTKAHADSVLDDVRKAATKAGVAVEVTSQAANDPYKAIIATAKKKRCELIVMASHGRRGLAGLVLGSETQKVLTHTKIPVLVVR